LEGRRKRERKKRGRESKRRDPGFSKNGKSDELRRSLFSSAGDRQCSDEMVELRDEWREDEAERRGRVKAATQMISRASQARGSISDSPSSLPS